MYTEGKISTFRELMDEVTWSWEQAYEIHKHEDGYSLNKLYIKPTEVTYKTSSWELAPGVFEKFERFYALLQEK